MLFSIYNLNHSKCPKSNKTFLNKAAIKTPDVDIFLTKVFFGNHTTIYDLKKQCQTYRMKAVNEGKDTSGVYIVCIH